jgi:hypothetical protein
MNLQGEIAQSGGCAALQGRPGLVPLPSQQSPPPAHPGVTPGARGKLTLLLPPSPATSHTTGPVKKHESLVRLLQAGRKLLLLGGVQGSEARMITSIASMALTENSGTPALHPGSPGETSSPCTH